MSLNHILKDVVPDDEKLDVKFKDVYCENLYATNQPEPPVVDGNFYERKYQQFTETVATQDTPVSIINTTSSIGNYLLDDFKVGTRYEFSTQGDYLCQTGNAVYITIKVGNLTLFSITNTIQTTVGGHKLSGHLIIEQIGGAGVAIILGGYEHTFSSSTAGTTTTFISSFFNDTTFSTLTDQYLGISANWTTSAGHIIGFRDLKLDRVG